MSTHIIEFRYMRFFLAIVAAAVFTGCAAQPNAPVITTAGCETINSNLVDAAFDEARNNLSRQECVPFFQAIFNSLKVAAKGNPGEENKARFAAFLTWSNQQGIITVMQSKRLYNRYFNETFISLPDQGNVCSHMLNQSPVKDMTLELSQKREGYTEILGDSKGYDAVHAQYLDMKLMLESVATACQS